MKQQLQFNPDDTRKFLSAIAPGETVFSFITHDDTTKKHGTLYCYMHGTFDQHEQQLQELNEQGAAINILVNQGDGRGHKAENIIGYRAVFLDLDSPAESPPDFPITPHAVVESSSGKFHSYWVIENGLDDHYYLQLQRTLANQYNGDHGVETVCRIMRVPGFYHQKDPSNPWLTRIHSVSGKPALSRQEFEDSFGFLTFSRPSVPMQPILKPSSPDKQHLSDIEEALTYIPADDRKVWLDVGMAIKSELDEDGFDLWDQWSQESDKYDARDQLLTWRSIKDRRDGITVGTIFHYAKDSGWSSAADSAVKELNKEYAVINMAGKVSIVHETYDHTFEYPDIEFLSAADFGVLYKNRKVTVNGKRKLLATHWLESPSRRQYNRVEFAPGKVFDEVFNLWSGYHIDPVKGNCDLYLEHIRNNICDKNDELYDYVIASMADAIQNPSNPPGVSIVMRGDRGTGKGVFVNWFGRLFGRHYIHIRDQEHLTGKFNGHLGESILVFADEAFWAGNKKSEGVLKGLITEPILPIERKYQDVIKAKNHVHLIVASNDDWVIPAGFDERRFLVLDVSDRHKQDHKYFGSIKQQMKNGGLEALMYHLQNYDLSKINLRQVPQTSALADQKLLTMDGLERWWYERLQDGAQLSISDEWKTEIPIPHLYDDYKKYCKGVPYVHIHDQQQFGKRIKKPCPSIERGKHAKNREYGKKLRHYNMPQLEVARSEFEKWFGHSVAWDEGGVASKIDYDGCCDDILL